MVETAASQDSDSTNVLSDSFYVKTEMLASEKQEKDDADAQPEAEVTPL